MGEIDKNPIPAKHEVEEARQIEILKKELADTKVELAARDSACEQALLKLETHQNITNELALLLKRTDSQKDYYIHECQEANARVNKLQSCMDHMVYQLSESQNTQEQLTLATTDLEEARIQLAVLKKAEIESISQLEEMKSALSEEKLKGHELSRQVLDMKETIIHLKKTAANVEQEKAKLESSLFEANEELKKLCNLDALIVEKTSCIDSLQRELKEVNELHSSSQKAASKAIDEVKSLKKDIEVQEKVNSEQSTYIGLLEAQMKEVRTELGSVNIEAVHLSREVEGMKAELQKSKENKNDAQVEIALLKFELHKGRSKLAAAEATAAQAQTEKTALYNALTQMGLETEETKKENIELKKAIHVQHNDEIHPQESHEANRHEKRDEEEGIDDDHDDENGKEVVINMRKELEMALSKVGELRTRAEQAISRAEAAEKAKTMLEEKIRKSKERKARQQAALEAFREESNSRELARIDGIKYEAPSPKHYQPLRNFLT